MSAPSRHWHNGRPCTCGTPPDMTLAIVQGMVDHQVDVIVGEWETRAAAEGLTLEQFIELEYRRVRPWWLRLYDRAAQAWVRWSR